MRKIWGYREEENGGDRGKEQGGDCEKGGFFLNNKFHNVGREGERGQFEKYESFRGLYVKVL